MTIETEPGAAAEPYRQPQVEPAAPRPTWPEGVVRLALLVVLLIAGLSLLVVGQPRFRSQSELVSDLQSGRVTSVRYDEGGSREVSWTVGWWHSYRADLERTGNSLSNDGADGTSGDGTSDDRSADGGVSGDGSADGGVSDDGSGSGTSEADRRWLNEQLSAADAHVPLEVVDSASDEPSAWTNNVRWDFLRTWANAAWWVSLAMMLFRPRRTVANRWAWFWLFTIGGVGAIAYLVLEPYRLWHRPSRAVETDSERQLISGPVGFVMAFVLAIGIDIVVAVFVDLTG